MTTILINEKTKKGRIILDLIKVLGVGEIVDENNIARGIPNKTTIRALKEIRSGETTKCENFDEYLVKTNL